MGRRIIPVDEQEGFRGIGYFLWVVGLLGIMSQRIIPVDEQEDYGSIFSVGKVMVRLADES